MNCISFLNIALISLFLLHGVSSQAQVQSKNGRTYHIVNAELDNEKIRVLHFRMSLNEGVETMELVDSKERVGHLKEPFKCSLGKSRLHTADTDHADKQLKCSLLNAKKNLIFEQSLEYPLVSHYEFPLDESSGEMSHIAIEQEKKNFFIRIPAGKDINYLKFLTLDTQTKKTISEFEFIIN